MNTCNVSDVKPQHQIVNPAETVYQFTNPSDVDFMLQLMCVAAVYVVAGLLLRLSCFTMHYLQ